MHRLAMYRQGEINENLINPSCFCKRSHKCKSLDL